MTLAVTALEDARVLVQPVLRRAIDGLPGAVRHLAGYHMGYWDERGQRLDLPGGKALRPALVLAAARAVGDGPPPLEAAAAVELVHDFSLIHDDVMDGDALRRHRPTVWKVFGVDQAILAGDALLALAFTVLSQQPREGAAAMLASSVTQLLEGQASDLAFQHRRQVSMAECLAMARRKTGALLDCSAGLGALYGGGTPAQVTGLRACAAELGLAFQLADDLLGIWGHPDVTGKPAHSDLTNRKKSLPVVAALTADNSAARALAQAYAEDSDPAELADLVEEAGGRAWCREQIEVACDSAMSTLDDVAAPERTGPLRDLAEAMIRRDH